MSWSKDTVKLWDRATGALNRTFERIELDHTPVLSDDRHVLATLGFRGLHLWDTSNGNLLHKHALTSNGTEPPIVSGVCLTRNGAQAILWGHTTTADIYEVKTGQLLHQLKHDSDVAGALICRQDSLAVTWTYRSIRVWDLKTGKLVHALKGLESHVRSVVLNRDESRILAGDQDGITILWDLTSGDRIQTFANRNMVNEAKFSPDEKLVLTRTAGSVRVWSLDKSNPIQTFNHPHEIHCAVFSRNQLRVLTTCADGYVRVWILNRPDPIQFFREDSYWPMASYNMDETRIFTWGHTGSRLSTWDSADRQSFLTLSQRILEHEVRSASTIDSNQNLQSLSLQEWTKRTTSPEYGEILRQHGDAVGKQ